MLLSITTIQGFLLSGLLYFNKRGDKVANHLIGLLVFFFSAMLVEEALEAVNYHDAIPKITGSGFFIELFLGPLTYIYIKRLTSNSKNQPLSKCHLVIPILINIAYLPYHLFTGEGNHFLLSDKFSSLQILSISAKGVFQLVYQVSSVILLSAYLKQNNGKESPRRQMVVWMRNILLTVLILIPVIVLLALSGAKIPFDSDFLTSVIMILSIYTIGYMALKNPVVFTRIDEKVVGEKYKTSSLSEADKVDYTKQLIQLMEVHEIYLDQELKLEDLGEKLNIDKREISQLLNEHVGMSFYDFVNSYRVEQVIKRLKRGDHKTENILTIGLESGFNSKATLNRAFKKITGSSPKEFCDQLKK